MWSVSHSRSPRCDLDVWDWGNLDSLGWILVLDYVAVDCMANEIYFFGNNNVCSTV